jgi:hypothetical protein
VVPDLTYQAPVAIKQDPAMCNGNAVRAFLVIVGLCASLTLGLSACSSLSDEGSSEPIREELYGGDRDRAPVHQEKMQERTSRVSRSTNPSRS